MEEEAGEGAPREEAGEVRAICVEEEAGEGVDPRVLAWGEDGRRARGARIERAARDDVRRRQDESGRGECRTKTMSPL